MIATRALAVLAAASVLALAGCRHSSPAPSGAVPSPSSATATAGNGPPPGAVTVENWGAPFDVDHMTPAARKVKIGEPVTFWHEGLAFTIAITSFGPTADYPDDLQISGGTTACGNYWRADYTLTVEAKNTTWKYWQINPQGLVSFFPNREFSEGKALDPEQAWSGPGTSYGDKPTSKEFIPSIIRIGDKHEKQTTYKEIATGSEYYPVCKRNWGSETKWTPSDKRLAGVRWVIDAPEELRTKTSGTEDHAIAEWWL